MDINDRIKLAEAVDLLPDHFQGWGEYRDALEKYDGEIHRILLALIPDPKNDTNDCNAVIKHLNGLGWHVQIIHYTHDHAEVSIDQHPDGLHINWEGTDWMHGVATLALKVIA